ncbi:MAG: hypothetical protein WDO68_17045 [Gammaproteobacteria bacterium]
MSNELPVIWQVLYLREEDTSREMGAALWAALIEVERFYNLGKARATFRRYFLSSVVPSTGIASAAFQGVSRLFRKPGEDALELPHGLERMEKSLQLGDARGRFQKTYDQRKLAQLVRAQLDLAAPAENLLIVTDCEITPPREWRYIISEDVDAGTVLSIAPLDPRYWHDQNPARVAVIKSRARAAALGITGEMLGIGNCSNPRCYLYEDVDSVVRLDFMRQLGEEHRIEHLSERGYDPDPADDVESVQPILEAAPAERQR